MQLRIHPNYFVNNIKYLIKIENIYILAYDIIVYYNKLQYIIYIIMPPSMSMSTQAIINTLPKRAIAPLITILQECFECKKGARQCFQ